MASLYGLGLAADALTKGLENLGSQQVKTELAIPEYEKNLMENQAALEKLQEFRQEAPLRRLKTKEEIETIQARQPYIGQLAQADVTKKLADAANAYSKGQYDLARINKLNEEVKHFGIHVSQSADGDMLVSKVEPTTGAVTILNRTEGPKTIYQKRLLDLKAQREDAELNAAINNQIFDPAKRLELEETRRYHDIQQAHYERMDENQRALRAAQAEGNKAEVEKRLIEAKKDISAKSRADIERMTVGEFGKTGIPGANENEKAYVQNYLINRQNYINAVEYFTGIAANPKATAATMFPFTPDEKLEKFLSMSKEQQPEAGLWGKTGGGLFSSGTPNPMPTPPGISPGMRTERPSFPGMTPKTSNIQRAEQPAPTAPQFPATPTPQPQTAPAKPTLPPVGQRTYTPEIDANLRARLGQDPREIISRELIKNGFMPTPEAVERELNDLINSPEFTME